MKNLYNTCKVSGKSLRIIVLGILTFVLFSSSGFASTWYTASDIYLQKDDDNAHSVRMHTGYTSADVGTLDKLWITAFHGWLGQDTDDLNGGDQAGWIRFSVYNVTTKVWGAWNTSNSNYWHWNTWNDGKRYPDFGRNDITQFNVAPDTPGSYQFQAQIKTKEKNGNEVTSPSNVNYVVSFKVPGFASTSISHSVTANQGVEKKIMIPYTHFGDNAPKSCTITPITAEAPFFTSYRSYSNSFIELELEIPRSTESGDYSYTIDVDEPYNKTDLRISLTVTVTAPVPEVLIAEDAVSLPGPKELLSGYLKYTGCENISKVGFVYSKTDPDPEVGTENCDTIEVKAADFYHKADPAYFDQGAHFSKSAFKNLERETAYYYRAFLYSETPPEGSPEYRYSDIKQFTTLQECTFENLAEGDTVYYTVDNSREKDLCSLRFQTIADAVADMKSPAHNAHDAWINASGFLTRPVVVEVIKTGVNYGNPDDHTRDVSLFNVNGYEGAYSTPAAKPDYRLIVRAKDANKRPKFLGGFDMRQSRYITLKNLIIDYNFGESSHEYSALEFGYYSDTDNGANACAPGLFTDTDIELIGCEVDATGFNCIHACGCEGLKFDQCVFNMKGAGHESNDRNWGASVKLMSCKNVQFTRNSIKGSHATLLWLQHTQNTLIMNNVFWNDNLFESNVAFIRPMMYNPESESGQKITNLGIYYNTFYLADRATICESLPTPKPTVCTSDSQESEEVDFLRFGGDIQTGYPSSYDVDYMNFKYNNCYSYDANIKKRSSNAFLGQNVSTSNFEKNNFWAKNDDAPDDVTANSQFRFGTETKHINVANEVCKSTADNPDELVVKGSSLSIGSNVGTDISGLDIATTTLADRFHEFIRPEGNTWTYGAFQTEVAGDPIDVITWKGGNDSQWDKRGNWEVSANIPLNCTHSLSSNLKVIIPDGASVKNIPQIPAWGDHGEEDNPRGAFKDEYVEAGLNATGSSTTSKFAQVIVMRDGAAIKGVENLHDGSPEVKRYDEVWNTFTIGRNVWSLVGSTLMLNENGDVKLPQSIDYYLNAVPQVYMRKVEIEGDAAVWKKTFSELWVSIPAQSAFAVRIPNEYGKYYLTADEYYTYMDPDAKVKIMADTPIEYTFYGRFYNEKKGLPHFTELTSGWNVVSNTYPANIKVSELEKLPAVSKVQVYTKGLSFGDAGAGEVIHPQQGFLIQPNGVTEIEITPEQAANIYVGGTSKADYKGFKSTSLEKPYFGLKVSNLKATGGSRVKIVQDELKNDEFTIGFDGTKVFNDMENVVPELYIMEYNEKLSSVTLPSFDNVIPLGVRLRSKVTFRFEPWENSGIESAILEDKQTGISVDLMKGETYTVTLPTGSYEGRFFLNLGAKENVEEVITQTEENASENNEIFIFSNDGKVVISSSNNVVLEEAYITDMSGKTVHTSLDNDHYNELKLVGSKGVYIIKAVGDKASRTEKVIVK